MKKFDKEDLIMIASFVSLNISFWCMALMTMTEKAENTTGFVVALVGFVVFLNLAFCGIILPRLPKKIKA